MVVTKQVLEILDRQRVFGFLHRHGILVIDHALRRVPVQDFLTGGIQEVQKVPVGIMVDVIGELPSPSSFVTIIEV